MSFIGKGGNRSLIGLKPVEKYGYEVTYTPFWLSIPIPATVHWKMILMFGIWMVIRRICKGQPMRWEKGPKQAANTGRIIPNYMTF